MFSEEHVVFREDCIKGMREQTPGTFDLIFADPPFNIGFEYDIYEDTKSTVEYLEWSEEWVRGCYDLLHKDGSFWIAIGPEYVSELDVLAKQAGFKKRNQIIWYYTFGVNCQNNFTRSSTHLLYYTKKKSGFTFNVDSVRVPSARQLVYNDKRANPEGRLPDNTWVLRPQDAPDAFMSGDQVWHCPRINGTFKARQKVVQTQMPEQILGRIIRISSDKGDLVGDPFCGSGTTLAVARKLGRRSRAWELSPDYAEAAQRRVDSVAEGDPLDTPDIQGDLPKPALPPRKRRIRT